MKFSFQVGSTEKHKIDFSWNQIIGALSVKVDGKLTIKKALTLWSRISWVGSPVPSSDEKWNVLDSGFEVQLLDKWDFIVGDVEKHEVRIEKERTRLLAGFRPQKYRVFIDGQLINQYEGY